MAASFSRSPVTPLHRQNNCKFPPLDPMARVHISTPGISSKRRCNISLAYVPNDNDENSKSRELQRSLEDFPSETLSKEFLFGYHGTRGKESVRGPLSSTHLSNKLSDRSRLRVAYQGVHGAYSESAAEKAYPNCQAVPCEQFETAFEIGESVEDGSFVAILGNMEKEKVEDFFTGWWGFGKASVMSAGFSHVILAVESWLVDRAVLPIENSLGGSIHRNYDLLLRHRLHIVGEVKFAVRHCLLANHGVKVEDLKRVLSHSQALAQCENTLTKLGLVREAVDDTAGAAKFIAFHKLKDAGAVASSAAARIYGLKILAQDIQDDSYNVTRFLMLAREPIIPGTDRPFKTSIVFSLEEGPGVLFKALAVFALRQINLTKSSLFISLNQIESRPLRNQPLRASNDTNNGSPNINGRPKFTECPQAPEGVRYIPESARELPCGH
ncbi:Arogenate dehydratase/prephenate dehydratase 2, chloroplastic [Vitis vinifera]|uniref:Arogenate dehydratase/prephenate dehydratase 2, chloroplastic n=1 Tax=Vitis vinifera TaxID=29760 RepID=A0A438FA20_VITVI|nr:Arogenate dehydratase/prephenate dehydratase 2, chloroplastic [Vitis vinifera]